MNMIVTKVSTKNPKVVRVEVSNGDIIVASGWTKTSKADIKEGDSLEGPKGYKAIEETGVDEAGQVFVKIKWIA